MCDHKILPFQLKNTSAFREQNIQRCFEQTEVSGQAINAMDHAFFSYLNQLIQEQKDFHTDLRKYMEKYYELCNATTSIFMARALTILPVQRRQHEIEEFAEKLKAFSDLLEEFSTSSFAETLEQAIRPNEEDPT